MKKIKIISLMTAFLLAINVFSLCGFAEETEEKTLPFTDVKEGDEFYDSIAFVYGEGVMNGIEETLFGPSDTLTRGMIVTIIYRAEGSPRAIYAKDFDDVADDEYYTEAVRWASANGIVNGVSENLFAPEENVTREQMAAIIYRYLGTKLVDTEAVDTDANSLTFKDIEEISDYAKDAMHFCIVTGAVVQREEGLIKPSADATRAEAANAICAMMSFKAPWEMAGETDESWKEKFKEELSRLENKEISEYAIYDLNWDNTPELLIKNGKIIEIIALNKFTNDGTLSSFGYEFGSVPVVAGLKSDSTVLIASVMQGEEAVFKVYFENNIFGVKKVKGEEDGSLGETIGKLELLKFYKADDEEGFNWTKNPEDNNFGIIE